jgi:hypothetical protein
METAEPSRLINMKSLGPLYGDVLQYYHRNFLPIVEKGWTQETEHPFRQSKVCLVFRIPFTKPGFVLGLWKRSEGLVFDEDADDMIAKALGLRDMELDTEEIGDWRV